MTTPAIEVKHLAFRYRRRIPILTDVSFKAEPGEAIYLLGSNGAGKSTLFRCLLGFLAPQRGELKVNGKLIGDYRTKELAQNVAYIPQGAEATFSYTAEQAVLMGRTAHLPAFSTPGKRDREIALEALDLLGVPYLANKLYTEISGGERQLVLAARAIAQEAKILIMDEPTASLDFGNQIKVLERVMSLCEKGYTVIQSSHNPNHTFLFADRVLVLDSGVIRYQGRPSDVLTESVIEEIYRLPVTLHEVPHESRSVKFCSPAQKTAGVQPELIVREE